MKINMRNSEEKLNGASCIVQTQNASGGNTKVRIAVFGQHEVGKSALTVRYLTKRYIGEYKSNTDLLYQQAVKIGNTTIDVEIVDISTSVNQTELRRKSLPVEEIQRADGFVIVYSITDRSSFTFAQAALKTITDHYNNSSSPTHLPDPSNRSNAVSSTNILSPKATCPILLIANKTDLEHLRLVEKIEGLNVSMQYGCNFCELSVAENSPEVYTSFQNLISTYITPNKESPKRKFSVTKMLGNLRLGRTSPSPQVVTSQASVVDTDIISNSTKTSERVEFVTTLTQTLTFADDERHLSVSDTSGSNLSNSLHHIKSKIAELHSMKKRQNSPPIFSL